MNKSGGAPADALFRMIRLQTVARQKWKRAEGVSLIEYAVIEAVGTWPGLTPSVIATTLGLPRNILSMLVTSLTDSGRVTRVVDRQDKRRARLFLTDEGHRLRASCMRRWEQILSSME